VASGEKLLVVDDDPHMLRMLARRLGRAGFAEVFTAEDGEEALRVLEREKVSLILSDVMMPGLDGMALLDAVEQKCPETPVVLMTAFGTIDSAVEAMRRGAADYVSKPFQMDEILITVHRTLEDVRLRDELDRLRAEVARRWEFQEMVGKSAAMQRVFQTIERAAAVGSTVLISGETGTGKEMAARAIHAVSDLKDRPFVVVDCSTIPDSLVESELFGVAKGAYTGAEQARTGLFDLADGGALLLDEIGCLSPGAQAKLLRVLQEGSIRPVGSDQTHTVNVRYIAATNLDLQRAVDAGEFREDLYYRLKVFPLLLPPLRERPEDIPLLAAHFVGKTKPDDGTEPVEGITAAARQKLLDYPWPGNVRELANAVEYALAHVSGPSIDVADLPAEIRGAADVHRPVVDSKPSSDLNLRDLVDRQIHRALAATAGNRSEAARILGIDRRTLQRHLARLKIGTDDAP